MRVLVLAAMFCTWCTAAVHASPSALPVTFSACRVTTDFLTRSPMLEVTFRNNSGMELSSVRVAMLVGGVVDTTLDDGERFAPGVSVIRRFQIDTAAIPLAGRTSCTVAAVRYADDTTWTNPALGASADLRVAQTPGSRIRIAQCVTSHDGIDPDEQGFVKATFVNDAPVVATDVTVSVIAGGERIMRIRRHGTFSPGVSIDDRYPADANMFPVYDLRPACRVDAITFADGTSWKNTAAQWEPYGTAQTPGSGIDLLRCDTFMTQKRSRFETPTPAISVAFRNTAPAAATGIYFAFAVNGQPVGTGWLGGIFSPGVIIDNQPMVLRSDAFPLGTSVPECTIVRVVYDDGTTWVRAATLPP